MSLAVESFRSLRLALTYDFPSDPNSPRRVEPCAGDGKSLVSSKPRARLCESEVVALLIDGDVRRGSLHRHSTLPPTPGLVNLHGLSGIDAILH